MKRKVTITINEDLYKKLETERKLRNRSISNLIETVLLKEMGAKKCGLKIMNRKE